MSLEKECGSCASRRESSGHQRITRNRYQLRHLLKAMKMANLLYYYFELNRVAFAVWLRKWCFYYQKSKKYFMKIKVDMAYLY